MRCVRSTADQEHGFPHSAQVCGDGCDSQIHRGSETQGATLQYAHSCVCCGDRGDRNLFDRGDMPGGSVGSH